MNYNLYDIINPDNIFVTTYVNLYKPPQPTVTTNKPPPTYPDVSQSRAQCPTMLLRGSPRVFWTWLLVFAAVVQADEANGPNPATLDASRRQSASSAIVLDQQEIDCLHTQALSTRAKWVLLQVQKCARRQS